MKIVNLPFLAAGLMTASMAASAVTIIDTGSPSAISGFTGNNRAAQFVINEEATIQSIESYFAVTSTGNLAISVYSNNLGFPGGILFSTTFAVNAAGNGWQGVGGLNWLIGPGAYWVATSNLGVAGGASYQTALATFANPMLKEASFDQFAVPPAWSERFLDTGWRVNGLVTAVPEPGTFALLSVGLASLVFARRRKAKLVA